MDPDTSMTVVILAVICIGLPVVLGVGGEVLKGWMKHREAMAAALNAQAADKPAQYAAHSERLEQRVRVLERIVTDQGLALTADIERLRDAPLN